MNELKQIADQLSRAVEGNAWHGPALFELLKGVSSRQAFSYPVEKAHSISEIVMHISAWQKAVEKRMNFSQTELSNEEDWPAVKNKSESEWKKILAEIEKSYKDLKEKILNFPEDKLNDLVPGKGDQTFYILLHGIIQHNLYHAGQIAILKKSFLDF